MIEVNRPPLPGDISAGTLEKWIREHRERTAFLQRLIERFETLYDAMLPELEARLARGEGQEHPDWEDSIEWRNAVELRQQLQQQEQLFVWLSRSRKPSNAS